MRVRITWWAPWADSTTTRPVKSAEGDIAGALQDARELLLEGRPIILEPLEEILHPDQARLDQTTSKAPVKPLEEKQPEGHWAACSCPICTGIRDRRYP